MTDFADYNFIELERSPGGVYWLGDELIPEIAQAFEHPLSEYPVTEELQSLIAVIGKKKTLQDNIVDTKTWLTQYTGSEAEATDLAAMWTEHSGLLEENFRYFKYDEEPGDAFDAAVMTGGVARWMNRRANLLVQDDELQIGKVLLAVGNRTMGEGEHDFVKEFAAREGHLPTEAEYASRYIADALRLVGHEVYMVPVDSADGESIFAAGLAEHPWVLDGSVLSVSNAPAAVFTAGQFRKVARGADRSFDDASAQLSLYGDTIDVARDGQPPSTHQNPFSALGQIARTALLLHENAEAA